MGAPKFPMPGSIQFLLEYAQTNNNEKLLQFVELTLDKMMMGGIYDQVGGGFARYSVDAEWKVPHFEKMLYDNAQLTSLYTVAFQITGKNRYLATAKETADFVLRELTSPEGIFYAALDADTEGEEGRFYVWTKQDFEQCLGEASPLFVEYFEVGKEALWEDGKNVLMRRYHPGDFARLMKLDKDAWLLQLKEAKQKLYAAREKRVRPGLDDKSLTSWNAMMIKALAKLSVVAGEDFYLNAALKAARLIAAKLVQPDGSLLHNYKEGKATIDGFLEDYAHFADAALELFLVTMDKKWLTLSQGLTNYTLEHFYDNKEELFWFTSKKASDLISRKKEIFDNVIPSSNAVTGQVFFKLSLITEKKEYAGIVQKMVAKTVSQIKKYPASLYRWTQLMLEMSGRFYEVAIIGPEAKTFAKRIYSHPYPLKIVSASVSDSSVPIFQNRFVSQKTMIYVCKSQVCSRPVETVDEALEQLV